MTKISAVRLRPYDLALKRPWPMAGGGIDRRRGCLVEVVAEDVHGFGDYSVPPGHTFDEAGLAAMAHTVVGTDAHTASERLSGSSFARAAVECAVLDLQARLRGVPLRCLLDRGAARRVAVNAVAEPERLAEAAAAGYRVVKIKIGHHPPQVEAERLRALVVPDGVRLRLDANRRWTLGEAAAFLDAIGHLPVDSLEEPLAAPTLADLAALQRGTPIAVALDESLRCLGVRAVLAARPVRRLVLKPAWLGGLRATQALAARARSSGFDCVVTSALDSAVGVAAAAHLAAVVEGGGLAHGLSTAEWLGHDVAVPLAVRDGAIDFDDSPGLGVCVA